jgi:drug/metabolite transporter (DMT)-like permease
MFLVTAGQERFSPRQVGAILVGVIGVVLLFGPSALAGTLDIWELIGAAGVTIGVLCYTAGSVITPPITGTLEPVQLAGLTDLIGKRALHVSALAVEPGAWESMHLHLGVAGVPRRAVPAGPPGR